MTVKRRRGRPSIPPANRKRNNLTFRARDSLKRQLNELAERNQRSISEEIEFLLERSFEKRSLLFEVMTLAYGRYLAEALMMAADAIIADKAKGNSAFALAPPFTSEAVLCDSAFAEGFELARALKAAMDKIGDHA